MSDRPMPASPQNISSIATTMVRPVGSAMPLRHEVHAVEPDLGGLLDDRPRELLALVPLLGRRTHDVDLAKAVDPLLQLELVLVQGRGRNRP